MKHTASVVIHLGVLPYELFLKLRSTFRSFFLWLEVFLESKSYKQMPLTNEFVVPEASK